MKVGEQTINKQTSFKKQRDYRSLAWRKRTQLVGVFGCPIGHTASPLMHNAAFLHLNLNYLYLAFEIKPEYLESAVKSVIALNFKGVNVTIPYKTEVIKYLDEVTPEAELVGSVNTIVVEGKKLVGYTTDGRGFLTSLINDAYENPQGKKILILGAGGAARALTMTLAQEGIKELIIANRTEEKAEALVSKLKNLKKLSPYQKIKAISLKEETLSRAILETDILINATSVGMKEEDPLLIKQEWLHPDLLVCDLIYNPPQTSLLKLAQEQGAKTLNGLGMLLYQGALSFELWTGIKAPLEVMREALYDKNE